MLTTLRVGGGSVLQLSMRKVHDLVAYCGSYEFEDVVADVTGADRIELVDYDAVETARRAYKLGRLATGSRRRFPDEGWAWKGFARCIAGCRAYRASGRK